MLLRAARLVGPVLLLVVLGAGSRAQADERAAPAYQPANAPADERAAPRRLDLRLAELPASQPASQPAATGRRPAAAPVAAPRPPRARSAWQRYTTFWDAELERIIGLDIWGTTGQLPKGFLTIKYHYNQREAVGRFDGNGNKLTRVDANGTTVPTIIPPIAFGDAASGKPCLDARRFSDCMLAFDAGAKGRGGSHSLQLSYGITGRLDAYVDVPMQFHHVELNPQVIALDPVFATSGGISYTPGPGGTALPDQDTYPTFEKFIKRLGRPGPKTRADHNLVLGDINTGISWNFLRTRWLSTALTYRVYFPTAYVADPDNSMVYFTGPDVDAGNRAWALGAGLGHDFRLPRFIHKNIDLIVSWEWNFSYAFPSQRDYPSTCPTVYNRLEPDTSANNICRGFRPPEPAASALFDPLHQSFPDLSGMRAQGSTFTYTPGFAQDMTFSLNASLWGVGVGVGIGQSWAQKPEVEGDPAFLAMMNNLQLVANSKATGAKLALSLPLFPLYLPAVVTFQYEHNLAGTNLIYYKNNFHVIIQGYIPDSATVKRH